MTGEILPEAPPGLAAHRRRFVMAKKSVVELYLNANGKGVHHDALCERLALMESALGGVEGLEQFAAQKKAAEEEAAAKKKADAEAKAAAAG